MHPHNERESRSFSHLREEGKKCLGSISEEPSILSSRIAHPAVVAVIDHLAKQQILRKGRQLGHLARELTVEGHIARHHARVVDSGVSETSNRENAIVAKERKCAYKRLLYLGCILGHKTKIAPSGRQVKCRFLRQNRRGIIGVRRAAREKG